ncbi:CP2-domain-containing protein [Backusella circina FSU 941]|nr:CP2-domain-containing protein [Backusella circina FSU 941]
MINNINNNFTPLFIDTCVPLDWIPQQDLSITPQSWSPDTTSESDLQISGHSSPRNQSSVITEIFNPLLSPIQSKSRYEVILEAPPAASLDIINDTSSLTYLNKGQYYTIRLKDEERYDGDIMSTIILTFHEESHLQESAEFWRFWLNQQEESHAAKATEIALDRSTGIRLIEPVQFDRISVIWNGKHGANIGIRFNCLSTDFSRIKGVKGIPLSLHVDTALNSSMVHSVCCRIKLFRDKGAERKNKDDSKHMKKHLERILQKEQHHSTGHRESEKIINYSRNQKYKHTQLCDDHILPLELSPTVTTAAMNIYLQTSVDEKITLKRTRNPSYYTPTASPVHYFSSASTDQVVQAKRNRIAKLCIFVRFGPCTTYRAIYLKELNLESLVSQISEKMSLDPSRIKEVLWLVVNKSELVVHVDDKVIESIPDNQDMEVSTTVSLDNRITLFLRY